MAGTGETPPPAEEDFPNAVCPNCGSPLTFESGRAEGFCANEGTYVNVARPASAPAAPPPLVRQRVLQATKRELHDLCRAYGLRVSGNKTDLLTRLLRYMDERGIDPPPEEIEEAAARRAGQAVSEASEAILEPAVVEAAAVESVEEPVHEEVDRLLEQVEVEAAALEEPELAPAIALPAEESEEGRIDAARLRRDRRIFYLGVFLVALGGPGLALASLAHDLFRVPVVGESYESFGPLNMMFVSFGAVVLIAGIVSLGVALRGGVVRSARAGGG